MAMLVINRSERGNPLEVIWELISHVGLLRKSNVKPRIDRVPLNHQPTISWLGTKFGWPRWIQMMDPGIVSRYLLDFCCVRLTPDEPWRLSGLPPKYYSNLAPSNKLLAKSSKSWVHIKSCILPEDPRDWAPEAPGGTRRQPDLPICHSIHSRIHLPCPTQLVHIHTILYIYTVYVYNII